MLHQVNLLPWRDEIRAQHKKRFINLVVLGTLAAVIAQWMVGNYFHEQKSEQQARLNYLQQYIAQLDTQIQSLKVAEQEHKSILTRLDVVESLQSGRNKTTEFMNLMPNLVPEGVYVDKIKMNGQEVEMSGISDSTARLATMLDNLERSESLSDVEMHSIVHNKERFNKEFQTFKVSFMFTPISLQKPLEAADTTAKQSAMKASSIANEQYLSVGVSKLAPNQMVYLVNQEVSNG